MSAARDALVREVAAAIRAWAHGGHDPHDAEGCDCHFCLAAPHLARAAIRAVGEAAMKACETVADDGRALSGALSSSELPLLGITVSECQRRIRDLTGAGDA